jgi:hypothetical protein
MKLDSSNLMVWGGILFAMVMAVAQEANKEWTIHRTGDADVVQFTVRRIRPGSHWSSTEDVPRSKFQGLSLDTLEHGGAAKFRYVADAGALECTGRFSWTGGSGDYTFVPNPAFASALRDLGYATPDQDEQFTMLLTGVTLDFARGVKDARLGASTAELIRLRTHGVTLAYIDDVRRAGYTNLLASDVIDLRIHGVSADFLQDLKAAGYSLSAQQAINLRIHGVDSDFVRKLQNYGLRPAAADLTQLRIHGVTPEYLAGMKDAGYGSLSADDLVQLRIHGVETAFAREARGLGYSFTPDDLVQLRIHGVDGAYLRTLRDAGMRNLTAEQIARLKMHGVD